MEEELKKELIGAIVSKLKDSSVSDLHQMVEILYEEELKEINLTH